MFQKFPIQTLPFYLLLGHTTHIYIHQHANAHTQVTSHTTCRACGSWTSTTAVSLSLSRFFFHPPCLPSCTKIGGVVWMKSSSTFLVVVVYVLLLFNRFANFRCVALGRMHSLCDDFPPLLFAKVAYPVWVCMCVCACVSSDLVGGYIWWRCFPLGEVAEWMPTLDDLFSGLVLSAGIE